MGEAAGAAIAVADAGPLIHLHEIGRLALLRVFAGVQVPQAVWEEVVTTGRVPSDDLKASAEIELYLVPPASIDSLRQILLPLELQRGELECLVLAQMHSVALLLTDDLAARDGAHRLRIRPVGSLGVVVRSFHLGLIRRDEAVESLEMLYDMSSLFVTRAIVEIAIEQLSGDAK